jgi:hypothetical protein
VLRLPVSNEKRLLVQRTESSTKPPSGRRKINLTGESSGESAEDGQHLPLTLHSYTNVYVADLCAYLSIYPPAARRLIHDRAFPYNRSQRPIVQNSAASKSIRANSQASDTSSIDQRVYLLSSLQRSTLRMANPQPSPLYWALRMRRPE